MIVEIKVPSVGESITEALLAQWFKSDGDTVKKDEPLFVIETDKVTLEVVSEAEGVLSIKVQEGETVAIGVVVGSIETAGASKPAEPPPPPKTPEIKEAPPQAAPPGKPPEPVSEPSAPAAPQPVSATQPLLGSDVLAPSVRRLIVEKNLDPSQISATGPGGRITKGDVVLFLERTQAPAAAPVPGATAVQNPPEPRRSRQLKHQRPAKKGSRANR